MSMMKCWAMWYMRMIQTLSTNTSGNLIEDMITDKPYLTFL